MKKFPILVLALLMLCGCGTEIPTPTENETTPPVTTPTEEVVVTHEALETYDLPCENVLAAAPMGDDILLFAGDPTTLVKLSGKQLEEAATAELGLLVDDQDPAVQVSENGVCYSDAGAVIFLDANLQETDRISLPEASTSPAVTADQQTIYYSVSGAIRSIDRETGLDRMLREATYPTLTITGLHAGDTVLECQVQDEESQISTLFISTETGALCQEYGNSISLTTSAEGWFASICEAGYSQYLVGSDGQNILTMTPPENYTALAPVSELHGAMITTRGETATVLSFYDTESGVNTAEVTLNSVPDIQGIWGDAEENCIWFLLDGIQLCRWDLSKSATGETASCLDPYYSRENPDTEGLAALESTVHDMEATYGVTIHIAEDAVAVPPDGITLVSEYRVDTLESGLEELNLALSRFTPEFLKNVGKASDDGKVHISLVRAVSGSGCIQFWDDTGIARIVLPLDSTLKQNFYHGLGHIIDARVMSECSAFDSWERLNPKGFDYDYDYDANQDRDGSAYADAFIDTFAMSFPTEDRARVFEYAMLDDADSCFETAVMQKKLSTLCSGIRKAFGLRDSDEEFPWEQYLTE